MPDNNSSPGIIFMGTPEFAVASLEAMVQNGFNVKAVVTAPDKPAGRGLAIQQTPVKSYALLHNIPVLQPVKLKDPDFLDTLRSFKADLQVVVAFRMLPEVVWDMPPMGTINIHGSLLPHYRGAAPINWAIINGETETGVSSFKLKHAIDTGDILLQEKLVIRNDETAGELHDEMKEAAAGLLLKTINGLVNGSLKEQPQESMIDESADLKTAPKIFTETCLVNWDDSVKHVYNKIRGLSPYPAAFSFLDGKKIKIYSGEIESASATEAPGTYTSDHKTFLKFACADGYFHVTDLQLEGKKRMPVQDFLRGYRFE